MKPSPALIIYGGSFDPLHEGHVAAVRSLLEAWPQARVLVVPARISPFKLGDPPLPPAVRWAMLREALRGIERVSLWDVEMRRSAPSYTCHTVQGFAGLFPTAELRLALGWDAFQDFARWHKAAEILSLAGLIVLDRAGSEPAPPEAPADWRILLPAPWPARVDVGPAGALVDSAGRIVLERLRGDLPRIAARELRETRSLEGVPAAARSVLAAHWRGLSAG